MSTVLDPSSEAVLPPAQVSRAFRVLFFTELWERFSFYGMRGILVLYLVAAVQDGGGGLSAPVAVALYSAYNSSIYLASLPGGWLADRVFGARRAVMIGGVLIAMGHFSMALTSRASVYVGLVLIAVGTGLLKPSISALVSQLYPPGSARRDSGFTLFYTAINLGAFTAPLVVGTVGENVDWHLGFLLSGIGMAVAVVVFLFGSRQLAGIDLGEVATPLPPGGLARVVRRAAGWAGVAAGAVLVDVLLGWFTVDHVILAFALLALALPVLYFARLRREVRDSAADLGRVRLLAVFFLAAMAFQMVADQAGSLLSLFAEEKVGRTLFGGEFPASWFQSVNPVFIILFAPVLALWWRRLGHRQPTPLTKFVGALFLVGLSFGAMGLAGLAVTTSPTGTVGVGWLLVVFWLQTMGELLLAPTGLALFTGLAPRSHAAQVVGFWFLSVAAGSAINSWLTRLHEPLGDVAYYSLEGALAIAVGIVLFSLRHRVRAAFTGSGQVGAQ